MTKALVLGRKRKGRKIAEAVGQTRELLELAGWTIESKVVLKKSELRRAARRAKKQDVDVVVAVGGDGAVFQVVNALAESDVIVGIIPKGTGNLLAGNLDIPKDLKKAVDVLVTGTPRRIDLGRVTIEGADRDFAVACGVGFDAVVMDATDPAQKRRWGKLAYVANAIREGGKMQDATHEITIDGEKMTTRAAQVFVANFGRLGALMEPRRRVIPDDGLLDVIIVRASGPLSGLRAGLDVLRQRELGETDGGRVERHRAREVTISSSPRQLVETDGSVIGRTPITVAIRPDALRVMTPTRH
jgi:YegS/Rv2252/BmrU family lipid kinase